MSRILYVVERTICIFQNHFYSLLVQLLIFRHTNKKLEFI